MRPATAIALAALACGACGGRSLIARDVPADGAARDVAAGPSDDAAADLPAADLPSDAADGAAGAPPLGTPWSRPVPIDTLANGSVTGRLGFAANGAGDAVAAWRYTVEVMGEPSSFLAVMRFDAAKRTWSAPQRFGIGEIAGTTNDPGVAIDEAGNAFVVWLQPSAGLDSVWSRWFDAAAGTWREARLVEIDDTGDARGPTVAALPGAGAVAAWTQWDGLRWSLWVNHFAGGVWTRRALLETTDTADVRAPEVATNARGDGIVTWTEASDAGTEAWAASRPAGAATWSAPMRLGPSSAVNVGAGRRQLALDAAGNGLAIWPHTDAGRGNTWASRFDASTEAWALPEAIGTEQGGREDSAIAIDGAGNGFATWAQPNGDGTADVWVNRFDAAAGRWMFPERLSEAGGYVDYPAVAAARDRDAAIVWHQRDSEGNAFMFARRFDARTGAWGGIVSLQEGTGPNRDPQVAVDARGRALAIFIQLTAVDWALVAAYNPF